MFRRTGIIALSRNGDPAEAATRRRAGAQSDQGLAVADAASRLKQDGQNDLLQECQRGILRIILQAAREPMLQLLPGASVIYLFVGDLAEALILLAFAVLNVVLSSSRKAGRTACSSLRSSRP